MWIEITLIAAGIALLVASGEVLVKNSSLLAKSMGISDLVVGLTVVAFGTSAPELAVNIMAALRGNGGISFGNIVGSNIANIGLVVGSSAFVSRLEMEPTVVKKEMPRMLLFTAAFAALAMIGPGTKLSRANGAVLIALFVGFLFLMYREARVEEKRHHAPAKAETSARKAQKRKTHHYLLLTLAGLTGLAVGGDITVQSAVKLAMRFNIHEALIGLSVVAIGTSLPELVVSVMATLRGNTSLAIGNIVGSNIFNLLLVGGTCSMITPFDIPASGWLDLLVMGGFSLLLVLFAATHRFRILRFEGAALLAGYISYIVFRFLE